VRFVADERASFIDRRKVQHFDREDPAEEAAELLKLVEKGNCAPREIRQLISYTAREKRCLEFLESRGLVASVATVLSFRDRVLEKFNNLVDTELLGLCERTKPVTDSVESGPDVVESTAEFMVKK
jgi:hypothetical protein